MTKNKHKLLGLLVSICVLTSCGVNMQDWPYCDLQNEIETYDKVTIEMIYDNSVLGDGGIEKHTYIGNSNEIVLKFYNVIEYMHRSPKIKNKTFENYWQRVSLIFEKEGLSYIFEYYEMAITDGYFIFNKQEIYEFRGDFYGVIQDFISKNMNFLNEV